MKKLLVIEHLDSALDHITELIKASEGKESRCHCKDLKGIKMYVETWIKYPVETALKEVNREVKK